MSGHSKWATTHRQKSAADAKRSSIFTRLAHAITIAAREKGTDIDANSQLRLAIEKARAANMPKDNIARAINRGSGVGADGAQLEELIYEVLGSHGSAFILEILTDNRNRTAGSVKAVLNKYGGQLAGPNSVTWMFERQTHITILAPQKNMDEVELALIEAGAEDIIKESQSWIIIAAPHATDVLRSTLEKLTVTIDEIATGYFPKDPLSIEDEEIYNKVAQLHEALEEIDDVSNIHSNVSI